MSKFVGLIILDGFGLREEERGNAIKLANPINFNNYFNNFPSTSLEASGKWVGLPDGQMGNSEVGHLNLGAGRVVFQSLEKINNAINSGEFFSNKNLLSVIEHVNKNNSTLHLMGLLSDGGVHSNISHLFALIKMAKLNKVKKVAIHVFTDGRDTLPNSGLHFVNELQKYIEAEPNYNIATIMGRFYAMDREQNYNYTKMAYDALVKGEGEDYSIDPITLIRENYKKGVYDEFIKPTIILKDNKPIACIGDNDGIIHFNFREDRARQLTASISEEFDRFDAKKLNNIKICTFTSYDDSFKNPIIAFPKENFAVNLSSVISNNGLKQFKIAETTKYAHVTYFINGGNEAPYKNEDRFLIETIKNIAFDKVPQMRAKEITDCAIEKIQSGIYDFMVLNYSNPDMVGHTGNLKATITAIKEVDQQLKRLVDSIVSVGGVAVIIADHGNAEYMINDNAEVITSHTSNKVPFILVSNPSLNVGLKKHGSLVNVAPTILELLNIAPPAEFTATSLILK